MLGFRTQYQDDINISIRILLPQKGCLSQCHWKGHRVFGKKKKITDLPFLWKETLTESHEQVHIVFHASGFIINDIEAPDPTNDLPEEKKHKKSLGESRGGGGRCWRDRN